MTAVDAVTGDTVALDDVKVVDRHRRDLGDLDELVESIRTVGLLHPVVVNADMRLVAGQRRLAAFRALGRDRVPVTVVASLDEARVLLAAERDENVCRKDMTPSEKVSLGRSLEEWERAAAAERQGRPGQARSGKFPEHARRGETRELVGAAVGMSGPTYQRAKAVVAAAEDESLPEDVRGIARKSVAEMDATGKVTAAYNRVAKVTGRKPVDGHPQAKRSESERPMRGSADERAQQIRALAGEGNRASQIADRLGVGEHYVRILARRHGITLPDAAIGRVRRLDPNRIVGETVNTLEGVALGVELLNGQAAQLDPDRVEGWATSLSNSLRSLNRLAKQLKEMAL